MQYRFEPSSKSPGSGSDPLTGPGTTLGGVNPNQVPSDLLIGYREARRLMEEDARACYVQTSDCLRRFFRRETEIQTSSLTGALRRFVRREKVPVWWKRQVKAFCRGFDAADKPPFEPRAVRLLTLIRGLFRVYYGGNESTVGPTTSQEGVVENRESEP